MRSFLAAVTCSLAFLVAVESSAQPSPVEVMVVFTVPGIDDPSGGVEYLDPGAQEAIQATATAIAESVSAPDFELTHSFAAVNAIAGRATPAGIAALVAHPNVIAVDPITPSEYFLDEAVPLVSMPAIPLLTGVNASGMTIAVIDSGVDATHPDLSTSIVGEACFCNMGGPCCPNAMPVQTGPGSSADSNGHGTGVAGVIASAGNVAPVGGAPNASIVAIGLSGTTGLPTFSDADLVAALSHVITSYASVDVVNLSLGSAARYATACDGATASTMAQASAINTLAAAGAVTIAASGNSGSGSGIAAPACLKNVISVGATFDAPTGFNEIDDVTPYTDSEAILDLVAPGSTITVPALGGGTVSTTGTSFAAPAVSACAALLKNVALTYTAASLTTSQMRAALRSSPIVTTDPKNGLRFPRLDCLSAARGLGVLHDFIYVADRGGSIMYVDPLFGGPAYSFPSFGVLSEPTNLQFGPNLDLFVTDASAATPGAVVRIDPLFTSEEIVASGGSLSSPNAIAVEPSGRLLAGSFDIVRIDPDAYDSGNPASNQTLLISSGGAESVGNLLREPSGDVLATVAGLTLSPSVLRLDANGTILGPVAENGHLQSPYGLTRNVRGELFVTDPGVPQIVQIDPTAFNPTSPLDNQEIVASGGFLVDPRGISALGPYLYVADRGANAIIKIEPDSYDPGFPQQNQWVLSSGAPLVDPYGLVALGYAVSDDSLLASDGRSNVLYELDASGGIPFNWISTPVPQIAGVSTNVRGEIVVIDATSGDVGRLNRFGEVVGETPNPTGLTGFAGVCVDSSDHVYLGDASSGSIVHLDANGTYVDLISSPAFSSLSGVAIDGTGGFWVSDPVTGLIHRIDASGTSIAQVDTLSAGTRGLFYDASPGLLYFGNRMNLSIDAIDQGGGLVSSSPVGLDELGGVAVMKSLPEPSGITLVVSGLAWMMLLHGASRRRGRPARDRAG